MDPETAFLTLAAPGDDVVWFDNGPGAEQGTSLIGWAAPTAPRLLALDADSTRLHPAPDLSATSVTVDVSILKLLRESLPPALSGLLPAWVGWFGHELGVSLLGAPTSTAGIQAAAVLVDRAIVFDHHTRQVRVVGPADERQWVQDRLLATEALVYAHPPLPPPPAQASGPVRRAHTDDRYLTLIRRCQDLIRAGQTYQLCLTNQWRTAYPASPASVYRRLRRIAPSHHGGLLRIGTTQLLSASPERFLEVNRDRTVVTRPMKGTRPRGATAAQDRAMMEELISSPKERAENLMIVDLVRNDLSRVCELGTVAVEELFAVETYRTVHQLVSTVSGRLREGLNAFDAFAALFPAGSMTGAPKRRAVELLHNMESVARSSYAGAFGYFAADGSADLATTIRTIQLDEQGASFGTGGGITIDSDPAAELREMHLKAQPLLQSLGLPRTDERA
ncbi:aminodeoxychorismate synthase component I [Streptomyces griseorubiginosus]|uniref:aminodeoxychorismate synthase component I n=1 Tax=Streptomyces griseorubiginosus TaxID=67304 RepID=UPI001AD61993|nr:aminodeoxychorismate synthase component I [Streptomyces griseorubiginosus]